MKRITSWQILVAALVIGGWPVCAAGQARRTPPRRPDGYYLYKMYREGKDEEARAGVIQRVRRRLDQAKKIKRVQTAQQAGMRVPSYVFFSLLGTCLGQEAKKGRTPEDVLKLCDELISAFDEGLPELKKWAKEEPRIANGIRLTVMGKVNLLLREIAILRDAGKRDRAKGLAQKHETFLKRWSVPIDELCGQKEVYFWLGRCPGPKPFRLTRVEKVDGKMSDPTYIGVAPRPADK